MVFPGCGSTMLAPPMTCCMYWAQVVPSVILAALVSSPARTGCVSARPAKMQTSAWKLPCNDMRIATSVF